jgi:hypothetical protein
MIHQYADACDLRRHLLEHAEQFCAQGRLHDRKAGYVATWMRQACH